MRYRKIGGLHFVWLGRLTVSFCWRKQPACSETRTHTPAELYALGVSPFEF